MLYASKKDGKIYMIPEFDLGCTSDKIWDYQALIKFLNNNQGKHIVIKIFPEAICLHTLGFYNILDCFKFSQVDIHTYNPLESHHRYNIIYLDSDFWLKRTATINPVLQLWTKSRTFMILYGRPTAARLALAAHMFNHHPKKTFLHFSATLDPNSFHRYELDKSLLWTQGEIKDIGNLVPNLPLILNSTDRYTDVNGYDYTDPLTYVYRHTLVDLVVESHVIGNTFFPTEKIVRPMLMKKPFIVFASKNFLDYLHQKGFMTFTDFWDETYDGFEGRDRLTRIIDIIDRLAAKSKEELEEMYYKMEYILRNNHDLLMSQTYKQGVTLID
jgi:hypothetical protein